MNRALHVLFAAGLAAASGLSVWATAPAPSPRGIEAPPAAAQRPAVPPSAVPRPATPRLAPAGAHASPPSPAPPAPPAAGRAAAPDDIEPPTTPPAPAPPDLPEGWTPDLWQAWGGDRVDLLIDAYLDSCADPTGIAVARACDTYPCVVTLAEPFGGHPDCTIPDDLQSFGFLRMPFQEGQPRTRLLVAGPPEALDELLDRLRDPGVATLLEDLNTQLDEPLVPYPIDEE